MPVRPLSRLRSRLRQWLSSRPSDGVPITLQMTHTGRKDTAGFTLTELLVVIAIVGILVALLLSVLEGSAT